MKPYFIITKKTIFIIFIVMVFLLLVLSRINSLKTNKIDGSTNAKRLNYIESLGLFVDDRDVSSKEIIIPKKFNNLYKEYNDLQKKSGFDLSIYKNKSSELYTYNSEDKKTQVHLIVYKGKIIGGDIAEIDVNGSIKPLTNVVWKENV